MNIIIKNESGTVFDAVAELSIGGNPRPVARPTGSHGVGAVKGCPLWVTQGCKRQWGRFMFLAFMVVALVGCGPPRSESAKAFSIQKVGEPLHVPPVQAQTSTAKQAPVEWVEQKIDCPGFNKDHLDPGNIDFFIHSQPNVYHDYTGLKRGGTR